MVWLIGRNGMLGSELALRLGALNMEFIATSSREADITDGGAILSFAEKNRPDWIINCAAYTAVDDAEDDRERARRLNALGPLNIALAAASVGANLVHISTDYVFDGEGASPYTESDATSPRTVYGETKLEGERNVMSALPGRSWIFRTAWLYGRSGKNFVSTMLRLMGERDSLKVVDDQRGTPTFTGTLSDAIIGLARQIEGGRKIPAGIYHCTDSGEATWHGFAREILRLGKKFGMIQNDCDIFPCASAEFPQKARRPRYSVLCKDKIQKELGTVLPAWQEALEKFMLEKAGSMEARGFN